MVILNVYYIYGQSEINAHTAVELTKYIFFRVKKGVLLYVSFDFWL